MTTSTALDFDDIPALITGLILVNALMILKTLVPFWEPAFLSMTIGLSALLILTEIKEERVIVIVGRKISAVFSKNNLISLISILFLSLLNFSCIAIYQIMR